VEDHGKLTFNNALYFVVVTLITVGYGEISPVSNLGKITALGILAITIIIVP
jgi:voltage-gated potassium channel